MLALYLAVLAAASIVEAADDRPSRHIHGAVAFIRSGERTPTIQRGSSKLTPLGAQQMHTLGQMFRGRYMGDDKFDGLGHDPINTLRKDIISPDQLFIQAFDRPHLYASAQAFMQGLYPPFSVPNATFLDGNGILSNGSVIEYPMGGYQYAPIDVVGELDPNSVYIAGDQRCPLSIRESLMYQATEKYLETKTASESFYDALDPELFDGLFDKTAIDYYNAISIYDYLSYAYQHDSDVFDTLTNDTKYAGVYERLRAYADESAWYFWGNTSSSPTGDDLQAMAGQTLSALVLGQLQKVVKSKADGNETDWEPLTLLFGEYEPIISLVSLLMLDYRNDNFRKIPQFGSTIVFELFSTGSRSTFPTNLEDLWVNFHYQNASDWQGELTSYPIFGNGPSGTDMPWLEFQDMMSRIMTNKLSDWCSKCSSGSLFCWGVDNNTIVINVNELNKNHKVSPAVAGAIGAVVTLAVAGILFALAMLVGGIRFHRIEPSRKSDLGGFKGSAKLASDQDLNLPKNGALPAGAVVVGAGAGAGRKTPHERVNSWELRQKEFGKSADIGDQSRRESFEAIEAAMSRPVEPTERV